MYVIRGYFRSQKVSREPKFLGNATLVATTGFQDPIIHYVIV